METSRTEGIPISSLVVLYDFRYMWKDNREISVKKGEKLLLLEKTNKDWWQVVRPSERKSFFVPAQYVEELSKKKPETEHVGGGTSGLSHLESNLYENLNCLKQQIDISSLSKIHKSDFAGREYNREDKILNKEEVRQKPIPKARTKVSPTKSFGERTNVSRSNSTDQKYPLLRIDFDTSDKSDKSRASDKIFQDGISNNVKSSSASQDHVKNYRGKNISVAVDNLVYGNVPTGVVKSDISKEVVKSSEVLNKTNLDPRKNRMKNSYNLKTSSTKTDEHQATTEIRENKQCPPSVKKLHLNQNFSKSLEKLAEEIQFEPKIPVVTPKLSSADNFNKMKPTKLPKENLDRKTEKKGKTNDASVILDENKIQPQSKSVFSRFRRSLHHSNSFKSNNLKKLAKNPKKACELSLSWEGGLDKIQEKKENEEKPPVTPLGLQRSRTFMFAERSPLNLSQSNKFFSGKHRLDTAYHSQRKPDEKVTLSTFKPNFHLDGTDPFEKKTEKENGKKHGVEKEKLSKIISGPPRDRVPNEASLERKKEGKITSEEKKNVDYINHTYPGIISKESEKINQVTGRENLTVYSEPYSNSETDDNLEEKSLARVAKTSTMNQIPADSNPISDPSESDENDSLEFSLESRNIRTDQPLNKRRTSLVRSSRVESSKVRKVTARLPSSPPLDQKPVKDLGDGWGQYYSKGGRSFYYNVNTGEKNWKPPRRTVVGQGSRESIYSDTNRSNTSSPLNEYCHSLSSLNRSNGSLHSKLTALESSSFDTPKSGSISRWKEDSPDDLNRSSYNSSPVAGLSQSSGYSLTKSSRDSLNRFSPVDNIPSEEEGFELHDHVYFEDANKKKESEGKHEEGRRKSKESVDTSAFQIKPGWKEFYNENLDQIYYTYKDRKEKWILSFDSEERAYFFEETSKKSLWALPDYSNENIKPDFNFSIQRSATDVAISNEIPTKLRQSKDGGKSGRISASTRSSKAQSMLIDTKFDTSPKDGSKTFSMPRDLTKIFGEIVRFGILNKTKICENGKKLRKNWTPAFVVLTDSSLFFFKDTKSFQNMKNIISSNGNHMCLSLQGAVIEKGDKISSRKNVYKISCSDGTDVLIQAEKMVEAEDWYLDINAVIQNLPQESNMASNSPSPLLDNPSKIGRTKSLKVRSKETGSVEDLSTTPEERQNRIKARLKKFFIRRPTVDSLKKKGIWKDEPVFGCSLEQITKNRTPRVPVFVEKCIECIESKEENMKTDGLYRASGNLSQVQKIRLEVDQNNLNIMKEEEDVHVLTGSLKLFFRELKEPLIPSKQLEPALLATDKQVRKERIKDFQKIVKSLPAPNYDTLKFLLQHLLRVKEYHKFNRMNINNLAIVFGPTLMWPEQESANMALELMQQNVVIECLLKEFNEIFT